MVNINLVDYEVTNPPYKVKNATFAYNRGNENVLQTLHSDRIQETKAVTFDHNDTYEVAPDEGFDAIRKAEVTVNITKKLYAWSSDSSGYHVVYSKVPEPSIVYFNDNGLARPLSRTSSCTYTDNAIDPTDPDLISSGDTWTRYPAGDITI